MDLLLETKILSCDEILVPVYSECVCIFLTGYGPTPAKEDR